MHAVVVNVTISDREAAAAEAGAGGGSGGFSGTGIPDRVLDMEEQQRPVDGHLRLAEEAATQSADRAREMIEANPTVSLINVEVREVVAHA